MGGPRLKIKLGDTWESYTQGTWVIKDKTGFPVGFANVVRDELFPIGGVIKGHMGAEDARALARFARDTGHDPVRYALDGHTAVLMHRNTVEIKALYDRHLHRSTPDT